MTGELVSQNYRSFRHGVRKKEVTLPDRSKTCSLPGTEPGGTPIIIICSNEMDGVDMNNMTRSSLVSLVNGPETNLAEIPWADSYNIGNSYLDALYGSVFASYDDFRICVSFKEYDLHISRSLICLAEAYEHLFVYEDDLLSNNECHLLGCHTAMHNEILNKLWLAVAMGRRGVVNELEITAIFTDWILIHVSALDRAYINILF